MSALRERRFGRNGLRERFLVSQRGTEDPRRRFGETAVRLAAARRRDPNVPIQFGAFGGFGAQKQRGVL